MSELTADDKQILLMLLNLNLQDLKDSPSATDGVTDYFTSRIQSIIAKIA